MEETKEQQQTQQLSEFDELIVQYGQDMTFCDFLQCQGFDETRFTVPLQFWFDLNTKRDDEWFLLTDEIINLIGSLSNTSHNCSSLLAFISNQSNMREVKKTPSPLCLLGSLVNLPLDSSNKACRISAN